MTLVFVVLILAQTQYPKETNPAKIVLGAGLNMYQKVVSGSQGDICNFSPSCSHYAKQALSKYGPAWGLLMAADRLMRCNPTAVNYYGTYYTEIMDQKLYDPVEKNYIWKDYVKDDSLIDTTGNDVDRRLLIGEP
jgi:putative component of membrane protein insertase Oxa1/YidC/SpoIIIJ protein YidD